MTFWQRNDITISMEQEAEYAAGPPLVERFRFDIHYLYCYLNLSFSLSDVPDLPNLTNQIL